MVTLAQILTVGALLIVPGPTNILLAASGAAGGARAGLPLGVAAATGYLVAVTLLTAVAGPALTGHPLLPLLLKAAATVWLLVCAVRLWRNPSTLSASPGRVGAAAIFLTTLLNPKALVFALALAPADAAELPGFLAALATLTVMACMAWAGLGSLAARGLAGRVTVDGLNKGGAVVLTGFAAALGVSALG
ncbi:LysE family transporter [uncultured Alsobacter sp.]|uniref:LysE family transporter n=1 Tax=uncultured Alsobacter sp. TaxID=1748258 RepID=UPI0025D99D31|nr:LysE family transporter [uncultured Alsobacter sp.]